MPLDEAERWARKHAGTGDEPYRIHLENVLAVLLAEYDRRGTELAGVITNAVALKEAFTNARAEIQDEEERGARLVAEINRLRVQANCSAGHDPERICCAHAADVEALRAQRDAVLALHNLSPAAPSFAPYCSWCHSDEGWPCTTARAIGVTS